MHPLLITLSVTVISLFLLSILLGLTAIFLRVANVWTAGHWRRLEAVWEPAIFEVLSGERPTTSFWDCVAPRDRIRFLEFLHRYARRLAGDERDRLCEAAVPFLEVAQRDARRGDAAHRARVLHLLGSLGGETVTPLLREALGDPSPLVAMIAARDLTRRNHPQDAGIILDRLDRFANWSRAFLATMLADFGPPAAEDLRRALSDPHRPIRTRVVATEAIHLLLDLPSGDAAAALLSREEDPDLLAAALRLLASVGRPDHLPAIRGALLFSSFVVRLHAVSALAALGGRGEIPLLRASLEDPSPWVAAHAARGLFAVGGENLLRELAAGAHPRADLARQVLREKGAA